MIRIQLLQPTSKEVADSVHGLGSKCLAAIAYLAVENRSISREELTAVLWDHEHSKSKDPFHDLRNTIYELRKALGRDIIVVSRTHGISIKADCDIREFVEAIQKGCPEKALALYRGEFLGWLSLGRRPDAWDDWVTRWRDDLRAMATAACIRLADEELAQGRHEKAIERARHAISVDRLDDSGNALLIRALLAAGRRSDAVRHYRRYSALMRAHLGVPPDAESTRLIGAVRGSPSIGRALSQLRIGDDVLAAALAGRKKLTRKVIADTVLPAIRLAELALESADNEQRRLSAAAATRAAAPPSGIGTDPGGSRADRKYVAGHLSSY